jgi:hypothetical protein
MALDWFKIISVLGSLGFVATATVATIIFVQQRRDAGRAARREVRVRLSQVYMTYHAELLRSQSNIDRARELFYPDYNADQTAKILFTYLWLNASHLEWQFVQHFGHPRSAFRETVDGMFGRLVKHASSQNQFLLNDFEDLFSDFPSDFRVEMKNCIDRNLARKTGQNATGEYPSKR